MDVKENEAEWIWSISELKFCNSYSRMGAVIGLYGTMPPEQWWRVLGCEWTSCDNIASYTEWLKPKCRLSSRLRLNMMNRDQRAAYDALPDSSTIYKGCCQNNRYCMSWTLDRDVAADFPTLNRSAKTNPCCCQYPFQIRMRVSRQ